MWNYVLEKEILFTDICENGKTFLGTSIAESIRVNDTIGEETNIMVIQKSLEIAFREICVTGLQFIFSSKDHF